MSKQFYDVTIRTDVDQMHTILQVVKGSAVLIGVVPVTTNSIEVSTKKVRSGNKKPKGTAILGLELLKNGPMSKEELGAAFEKEGYSATSYSPTMSSLRKDGKTVKLQDGRWALV